jgi:hypothetical protein
MRSLHRVGLSLGLLVVGSALFAACGSETPGSAFDGGTTEPTADGETPVFGGEDGGAGACTPKKACGDGGVCAANGACCSAESICNGVCCAGSQVCSFGKCEAPGATCINSDDCGPDGYCELKLGTAAPVPDGGSCTTIAKRGKCLPRPKRCGEPGAAADCVQRCEVRPAAPAFDPVVKYTWGSSTLGAAPTDVMMTPIVIQLDDDNCDGKVGADDIPEIVFTTFRGGQYLVNGTMHVLSVKSGQLVEKFSKVDELNPAAGLAAGDVDGNGVADIVGCMNPLSMVPARAAGQSAGVVAYRADGTVLWRQTDITKVSCTYEHPAIGDVDGDGFPEVLVGFTLLNGRDGTVKRVLDPSYGYHFSSLADLDGDGKLDVTDGRKAFKADGTLLWDVGAAPASLATGYHAIGDFNRDGKPDVVLVQSDGTPRHSLDIYTYDATQPQKVRFLKRSVDINNGTSTVTYCNSNPARGEYGGGPPTVADFNGDGVPDVGVAGAVGYIVLNGAAVADPTKTNAQSTLWFKTTRDCSSAVTGSSVFDFNGDGKSEVVYSDEYKLWMYDGATGANLIADTCNTTGTLWEYPVIADVDGDGQADMVVVSNSYAFNCGDGTSRSGVRVYGSASNQWVRSRRVWNQHTYHITNINEDGTVPRMEATNWTQAGLNNFRQNKQPTGQFSAPDLVLELEAECPGANRVIASVRNLGEAPVPVGAEVVVKDTGGVEIGRAKTTRILGPFQEEQLFIPNRATAVLPYTASVSPPVGAVECRAANNAARLETISCGPR